VGKKGIFKWIEVFLRADFIISLLMIFSLLPVQHTTTFSELDNDVLLTRSGILLCIEQLENSYVPVEVNSFKPGDEVVFFNELNVSRRADKGLTLNLTLHITVF